LCKGLGADTYVEGVSINDLRKWRAELTSRNNRWANGNSPRPAAEGGLSAHTVRGYIRACRRFFA